MFLPVLAVAALLVATSTGFSAAQGNTPKAQLNSPSARDARRVDTIKEEVRHQLVMLPYYSLFDWLQAEARPDGTVVLSGQVTRPTLKDDAANRLKNLESISKVVNNIEVLPLSPMDDDLRIALYRALFRYDSPLFRYGTQSVPPIHIIVKNGRVALKGIVATQMDSQLAETAARMVPGIFEVKNELQIEGRQDIKVSRK
jgi:hyperosmotically inducible protein